MDDPAAPRRAQLQGELRTGQSVQHAELLRCGEQGHRQHQAIRRRRLRPPRRMGDYQRANACTTDMTHDTKSKTVNICTHLYTFVHMYATHILPCIHACVWCALTHRLVGRRETDCRRDWLPRTRRRLVQLEEPRAGGDAWRAMCRYDDPPEYRLLMDRCTFDTRTIACGGVGPAHVEYRDWRNSWLRERSGAAGRIFQITRLANRLKVQGVGGELVVDLL